MRQAFSALTLMAFSLLLVACSSSSDSGSVTRADIALLAPATATTPLLQTTQVQLSASGSMSAAGTLTYQWSLTTPDGSTAVLSSDNQVTAEFSADVFGGYKIDLQVTDGDGNTASTSLTFKATDPQPVAEAADTLQVPLGSVNVGLDGSASQRPEGGQGELKYHWALLQKPDDSDAEIMRPDSVKPSFFFDLEGEYRVQLVVSYQGVRSQPHETQVSVFVPNARPVPMANNIEVTVGQLATLDASASFDPEGKALQYRWRMAGNPMEDIPADVTQLSSTTSATTSFIPTAAGDYEVVLFVFDGELASEEKTVTVTAQADANRVDNLPPVGKVLSVGYYPSSSFGQQEVGLRANFQLVGYDPEGEELNIIAHELLEKPAGSTATLSINKFRPQIRQINKLDKPGTYRVRITFSDGVNEVSQEASMVAKVGGVNNYPSASLDVDSRAVLTGKPLIFNANASDKDGDPLTYEWTLIDKPDGSNATIEAVIHPDNHDYSRALVVTDKPGVYRARMRVKDDRGAYDPNPDEAFGYAKSKNLVPQIIGATWTRSWGLLPLGDENQFYQLLPCMSLLPRALVVDLDGDEVFTASNMIATPQGGQYTSYPSDDDCPHSRGRVFSKPGQYTLRYSATDVISDAPDFDFVIDIEPLADARGVLLRNLGEDGDLLHPLPYKNLPPFGYVQRPTGSPILEEAAFAWSLEAMDGDYTIENVTVEHINGGLADLTPQFEGLANGVVIKQGETLNFKTILPAVPCLRTDDKFEGFHFSFNIKEIPEITFEFERWVGDSGFMSSWEQCRPGQLN